MPFIRANDLTIHYEMHGDGPAFLLIGGFTTHLLIWKEYIKSLSKKYRLILLDNRGSGQTECPETPYSIKMMAADVAALLDALKISSAHILGHSMGGAVALQLCIDHPEKVKKALICASAAKFPATATTQILNNERLSRSGISRQLLLLSSFPWLYSDAFLSNPKNVEQALQEMLHDPYPQSQVGYLGQIQAIIDHDVRDKISSIQAKTCIICGEHDLYTPLYCSEYLARNIPRAELKIIQQQAHLFNRETPEEFMLLIFKFLDH